MTDGDWILMFSFCRALLLHCVRCPDAPMDDDGQAGFTYLRNDTSAGGGVAWSGYRILADDPVLFRGNLFTFLWRNGDKVSPETGQKCRMGADDGGVVEFEPTRSVVSSYSWIYEWA